MRQYDPALAGTIAVNCPHCGRVSEAPAIHARICKDADKLKTLKDRLDWFTVFAVRVHNAKVLPPELQDILGENIDLSREALLKV